MRHIALIIPGLDRIGGAERQVILLAHGLCARGWRVSVVALSGAGGDAAAQLTASGVAFLSLSMRKGLADPRGWMRFHRWLQQEAPDVVHAHLPHAAWMARWSRLGAPVRVVVDTLHSSFTGTPGRRLGYRVSGWLSDQVTAVSHAVADAHRLAGMAGSIEVFPNGVDVAAWRPNAAIRTALRRELALEHEFIWFAAGRLEPVKDYPTLLQAMADLPESARLIVAGSGPLEIQLRQLSTEFGLDSHVRFLGFDPNILRWMQAADGFVLSSRWEGLPMALLEAAACALPAVATDVPGTREVVVDGDTGLLAPQGRAASLAGAMSWMMNASAEERKAMGVRARQRVIDHFGLECALNRWEALYADLLQRNRRPTRFARKRM
jgi:glycosyltransferase involved in cell wall biosynthesis